MFAFNKLKRMKNIYEVHISMKNQLELRSHRWCTGLNRYPIWKLHYTRFERARFLTIVAWGGGEEGLFSALFSLFVFLHEIRRRDVEVTSLNRINKIAIWRSTRAHIWLHDCIIMTRDSIVWVHPYLEFLRVGALVMEADVGVGKGLLI